MADLPGYMPALARSLYPDDAAKRDQVRALKLNEFLYTLNTARECKTSAKCKRTGDGHLYCASA